MAILGEAIGHVKTNRKSSVDRTIGSLAAAVTNIAAAVCAPTSSSAMAIVPQLRGILSKVVSTVLPRVFTISFVPIGHILRWSPATIIPGSGTSGPIIIPGSLSYLHPKDSYFNNTSVETTHVQDHMMPEYINALK